jgi:PAS domain S-box-containing protein
MSLDYRYLFEHARDGMVVFDASLNLVCANDAFAALIGVPGDELIGRSMVELIHPDDLDAHPIRTAQLERERSIVSMRRIRRSDGTSLLTEVAGTQLPRGEMFCVVRVTGQRDESSVLRDTEARFRAVAESMHAGLVVTDLRNRAVYVNQFMCAHTGYLRAELIGKDLAVLLFSLRDQAHDAVRHQRRLAGQSEVYVVEHRRKDGTSFLGEVSSAPLHDGSGHVIGAIGVMVDVTERHLWAREMAAREQRYRTLFEVTPIPAVVYDVETCRFLAVNPAAVQHYGYSQEEFMSMTIFDIRPPEEVEKVRAQVIAWRGGAPDLEQGRLSRHRKRDGTEIEMQIYSHALEFEGRSARIVVGSDVTEQRRIRQRERDLAAQFLQAQKMEAVGRLAGGVAHDFNNLLSVVLNATSTLEEALPSTSPLREELSDIRQAAERGAALTRRLLAFGRKEVHAPTLVDINEVVANVERLLARALGGGVKLNVRRSPHAVETVADPSQLEQVLVNLAINARDAMPDGGTVTIITGEKTLSPEEATSLEVAPGPYATIEVADTGVGMDTATLAHAFEPFFTTKGPQEGTGLGLATVYGIVRQSMGAVTLGSTPGRGTQVRIFLPRGGAMARTSDPARGQAEETKRGSAGRVLLVEDEPRVRAQARRLLERCGYSVDEAADGAEGERVFRARGGEVDVVVTDVVMPVLGGVEMVARLRAERPDVSVVFVSGFTAEDRALPLDERTAFVPKPYTIAALCEAIAATRAS